MARLAKTPRAGTLIAIPLLALLCAAGTSQAQQAPTQVDSTQVYLGDVFTDVRLDVVTADSTTGMNAPVGNHLQGSVEGGGSANVHSTQTLSGQIYAHTVLNVSGTPGATSLTTAVTGNTGDADVAGGGSITGDFHQTTTQSGDGLTARTQIEGDGAHATGDIAVATQTIANSQGFGVTDGSSHVLVTQANSADALSDGGAILTYVPGTAVVSAATVGNNVSAVGVGTSTQKVGITQTNTSSLIQASKFTAYGNAQETVTSATASANNVNITNEGPSLDVTSTQSNSAYVRAQAEETAYEYGSGTATAYGVGNSVIAGNHGEEVHLDNNQTNTGGGVDSVASFSGDTGYDAYSSATAMGNAATGYACSACGGTASVINRQTNSADIGASSTVSLTGAARNVTGVATAVGNSGSFYVSAPHN